MKVFVYLTALFNFIFGFYWIGQYVNFVIGKVNVIDFSLIWLSPIVLFVPVVMLVNATLMIIYVVKGK